VRTGLGRDAEHGAVVPPIHLSSNFTFEGLRPQAPLRLHAFRQPDPRRAGRGARRAGRRRRRGRHLLRHGGDHAGLPPAGPGDLLLAPHDCYGGTHRLLSSLAARGQFRVEFVDQSDPARWPRPSPPGRA
jgi:cystathionine gamma-synthase